MSPQVHLWLGIVGVALTGIVTRLSFLAFGARVRLAPPIERALRFAPAAALGAILGPALFLVDDRLRLGAGNPRLVAALVAGVIVWRTRSILWTIVGGLAVFTLVRLSS